MLFLIGRSADTLANIPERVFGEHGAHDGHRAREGRSEPQRCTSRPPAAPRSGRRRCPLWGYVGRAWLNSIFYAAVLLTLSAIVFRKRDFQ